TASRSPLTAIRRILKRSKRRSALMLTMRCWSRCTVSRIATTRRSAATAPRVQRREKDAYRGLAGPGICQHVACRARQSDNAHGLAGTDDFVNPAFCQTIDVASGNVYPGVKSTKQRLTDIEAECENIAALWPTI